MRNKIADEPILSLGLFEHVEKSIETRVLQLATQRMIFPQIYINIALCCFYAQQFDLTITCVERALQLSKDDATTADIWYNLSHIAIVSSH